MVAWPHTEVVGGRGIDVQLRRDAGALQGQVRDHAVIGAADDIVPAVRQKDRGRLSRDPQPRREILLVLGLQIARIAQDGEIGPATDFVGVVDRFIRPLLETGGRRQRQVAARRETDDADPLRVDSPLPARMLCRPPRPCAASTIKSAWSSAMCSMMLRATLVSLTEWTLISTLPFAPAKRAETSPR